MESNCAEKIVVTVDEVTGFGRKLARFGKLPMGQICGENEYSSSGEGESSSGSSTQSEEDLVMRDSYCVNCGKSFCLEGEDRHKTCWQENTEPLIPSKKFDCENILIEDHEIEQEIQEMLKLKETFLFNQNKIDSDKLDKEANIREIDRRLEELSQFNTPCGVHREDEDSEEEGEEGDTDEKVDTLDCTYGPVNKFKTRKILKAFCANHSEPLHEKLIENRCSECNEQGMVLDSKNEIEKHLKEKISQFTQNFQEFEPELMKEKLYTFIQQCSEEAKSILESDNLVVQREGNDVPEEESFLNSNSWVDIILKMNEMLKSGVDKFEVKPELINKDTISGLIRTCCTKFVGQELLFSPTLEVSDSNIQIEESSVPKQESQESSDEEKLISKEVVEEDHKSEEKISEENKPDENISLEKRSDSNQLLEESIQEATGGNKVSPLRSEGEGQENSDERKKSLEAQKEIDSGEFIKRSRSKSQSDPPKIEIDQENSKSEEKEVSLIKGEPSQKQDQDSLQMPHPDFSSAHGQDLSKMKITDPSEIKDDKSNTPSEEEKKEYIGLFKGGLKISEMENSEISSQAKSFFQSKSSNIFAEDGNSYTDYLQPLACTKIGFIMRDRDAKVMLYTMSLEDHHSGFEAMDMSKYFSDYSQGDYICINDVLYLFGYLKMDGSFSNIIYQINLSGTKIGVVKAHEGGQESSPELINKAIVGFHYNGANFILLSGGFNPNEGYTSDANYVFDPETFELSESIKLNYQRSHHSLCQMKEHIYVIGGLKNFEGKSQYVGSIERVHIEDLSDSSRQFQICMNESTLDSKFAIDSACVPLGDKILIFGGKKLSLKYLSRFGFLYHLQNNFLSDRIAIKHDTSAQIKIEHSVRFFSNFVVQKKKDLTEEKLQSGVSGLFSRLLALHSDMEETFKGQKGGSKVKIDPNEKLFFIGETNQGFPIIYTVTTNKTKINIPQKYSIMVDNEIIQKEFK
ncbi:unnamed protein product [Moneuplotes crassus]|uniref:Kelch motif family protein n=1 Tax=Euplotes crassus TaxID=5936 RepID=A0AAD1XNF6_EUPCR|nr:unnamed protein product [Moneuplotes crassus]